MLKINKLIDAKPNPFLKDGYWYNVRMQNGATFSMWSKVDSLIGVRKQLLNFSNGVEDDYLIAEEDLIYKNSDIVSVWKTKTPAYERQGED